MPSRPSVVAPPPALLRAEPSKILFSFLEKFSGGRAKEKIVKSILLGGERMRAAAGRERMIQFRATTRAARASVVPLKMGSNFFVQTPPNLICSVVCLGALRLGRQFRKELPRFFERNGQRARRKAAVHKRSLYCAFDARTDERFSQIVGVSALPFSNAIL
jgi:hypothetical protein